MSQATNKNNEKPEEVDVDLSAGLNLGGTFDVTANPQITAENSIVIHTSARETKNIEGNGTIESGR